MAGCLYSQNIGRSKEKRERRVFLRTKADDVEFCHKDETGVGETAREKCEKTWIFEYEA